MSPEQKRYMISRAYPGEKWYERVKNMSDAQVHNVYMRLLNSDKLKGIPTNGKF